MGGITRAVNVRVWCTANRLRVAALQDTGQSSPGLLPTFGKGHRVPRQGAQLCQSCRGWGAGRRSLLPFLVNSVLPEDRSWDSSPAPSFAHAHRLLLAANLWLSETRLTAVPPPLLGPLRPPRLGRGRQPLLLPRSPRPGDSVLNGSVASESLRPHGVQPTRLLCPWDSPGKSTGVGCHALLQGNLTNPRIEPGSPALQANSLPSGPPRKHP